MTTVYNKLDAEKLGRKGVSAAKAEKMIAAGDAYWRDYRGGKVLAINYTAAAYSHTNAVGAQVSRHKGYWMEIPVK